MNKFKLGDKIVRTAETFSGHTVTKGEEYIVEDYTDGNLLRLVGINNWFNDKNFELVESNTSAVNKEVMKLTYKGLTSFQIQTSSVEESKELVEFLVSIRETSYLCTDQSPTTPCIRVYVRDGKQCGWDYEQNSHKELPVISCGDFMKSLTNDQSLNKEQKPIASDGGSSDYDKKDTSYNPLDVQEGGGHYKNRGIQPIEYANANELNPQKFNIVKYITRHEDKGGVEDLSKVVHYALLEAYFVYGVEGSTELANKIKKMLNI